MVLKVALGVDDVHPEKKFGLEKEEGELGYLTLLNDEFGLKSTMFVPFNWDGKFDISKNLEWLEWIKQRKFFEIAFHGYTHRSADPRYDSQEFVGMDYNQVNDIIKMTVSKFKELGVDIKGGRSPGWAINKDINMAFQENFKWIGDHFIGTEPIVNDVGTYRIPYTLSIDNLHSDHYDKNLILHSHISQLSGGNGWTDKLYWDVKNYLMKIEENNDVKYVTFSELVGV